MVLSQTTTRHNVAKADTDVVLAAADRAEPAIRAAVLAAFAEVTVAVPDLARLIQSGNMAAVFDAVAGIDMPLSLIEALRDATATAAIQGAAPGIAEFNIAFNDVNSRTIRWAEANAGKQIKALTTVQRDLIENIIREGIERGVHPSLSARRIQNIVPLMPNHQKSINRQWFKMLEDGIDPKHADKIVGRRAAKLTRYRATVIARTEAINAANMGQQLLWESAIDLGYIPQGARKVWVTKGDNTVCEICAVMNGQTVGIVQPFRVTEQATKFVTSGGEIRVAETKPVKVPYATKTPTAHPQCRCGMELEPL